MKMMNMKTMIMINKYKTCKKMPKDKEMISNQMNQTLYSKLI
jgi:hypothetical protein